MPDILTTERFLTRKEGKLRVVMGELQIHCARSGGNFRQTKRERRTDATRRIGHGPGLRKGEQQRHPRQGRAALFINHH
jgi:hypothetical protein